MQPKQRKNKKKCEYCHSSQRNYQKKLKRLIFSGNFKDHEDDKHSPSEFYYPEDLETFDAETETGITESQEATDDFINQQKSANTNKKTATDMNTLLRYMEANGMKNEKIESLPASELDHLLSKFFLNARKKNGEEYEPATVSSFQRSIQRYLSEKKYPFNILKDNEFEKSRKVLAAKRKSLVHEHGKGTSKNCVVVFIPTLRIPSKRQKS